MTFTITKKQVIIGVISITALTVISSSVYFFIQYRRSQALLKNPVEAAKTENQQIIAAVAKIVDVPLTEEPTVANVTDKEKLTSQPFFAKSENGDKVIFYPDSKRAILYRPETGKIIEMSVVASGPSTPEVAGAQTTTAPTPTGILAAYLTPKPTVPPIPKNFRLAILNGTNTPKLANSMQSVLATKLNVANVVNKDNAVNQDYGRTLVIDLVGTFTTEAKALSTLVNGEMTTLPAGEVKPDADVLVIIGSNWKP